jgi:2,3-bisphosphoglycerate-independent phosphoglycerate mutase
MSAAGVTQAVVDAISKQTYGFILVNFANPDMVGHTGILDAAVRAVETVDGGVAAITSAALAQGGAVVVTSDHGNCELMRDPTTGAPHTAHTTNPVPLILVDDARRGAVLRAGGRICDVAPTLLAMLGLPQPLEMTGTSLFEQDRRQ